MGIDTVGSKADQLQLYLGRKFSGISLQADPQYPTMWRVHRDGWVSDMFNLTRAKALARSMAHASGTEVLTWHNRQSPAKASPVRSSPEDASLTVFSKQTAPRGSTMVKVIAGPVEAYSERSLWAAALPLDPNTAAFQRTANDWDRIKRETAWGRKQIAEPTLTDAAPSDWQPCQPSDWRAQPDLPIPDSLRRHPEENFLRIELVADKSVDHQRVIGPPRWFCVRTKHRAEETAKKNLIHAGFKAYVPSIDKLRRHARRIEPISVVLFPSYLFVQIDPITRWPLIDYLIPGVDRLLCSGEGEQRHPIPVPDDVIAGLKNRELENLLDHERVAVLLKLLGASSEGLIAAA